MSETGRLEERLSAWAAAPVDSGDWKDVLLRAGEPPWTRRVNRRRLAIVLAALVVVAAAVVGSLQTPHGTPSATGRFHPPAQCGPSPCGPTGSVGPTGMPGSTGLVGVTGALGPTGPLGPIGLNVSGPTGPIGPNVGSTGPDSGPIGHYGPTGATGHVPYIGPMGFSARRLAMQTLFLATPIYWAGPVAGDIYEFTRNARGALYVRYLPPGVHVGDPASNFLVVATYPLVGAFGIVTRQAHGTAVAGPDGSIAYVHPKDKTTVLVAFPNVDYEIEIYDPDPAVALATAVSGDIRPVG